MSTPWLLRANPELQRCLWQELTATRLVVVPSALAVVLGAGHLAGVDALTQWALYAMVFLLVLWGSRLAADSYVDEVVQGTWDVQRLSVVSPASMVVGKLAGGAVVAWYGAACCLLALPLLPGPVSALALVHILLAGVMAQAGALASAIAAQRFRPGTRRGATSSAQLVGVLAAVPVLAGDGWGLGWGGLDQGNVHWWALSLPATAFVLAQDVLFTGWMIGALAQMVRREFGLAVTPTPWLAFVLFTMIDAVGFLVLPGLAPPPALAIGVAALAGAACSYGAALATPVRGDDLRRWWRGAGRGRWALTPPWLVSAGLSAALALLCAALADGSDRARALVLLALFTRDLALIAVIRLLGGRRASLGLCVAALVLYWLWPTALGGDGAARWAEAIDGWDSAEPPVLALYWSQAALALALAVAAARAEIRRRA